jgi:hypothetical protein
VHSLLLDADVIIDLHHFEAWEQVVARNKVYIPSIILRQETYFYENPQGKRHSIELMKDLGTEIQELAATVEELAQFTEQFDLVFRGESREGEKEALFLLQQKRELLFCTCDRAAIKALAILGMVGRGISFESVLRTSGLTKTLDEKHTERRFKKCLAEGSIMKIQNRGLKK